MIKTFEEIKGNLEMLKSEIKEKNGNVDAILVGSWVDRVVIILEQLSDSLSMLSQKVDTISMPETAGNE